MQNQTRLRLPSAKADGGQVPNNWQKIKLGSIGKVITGNTPPTSQKDLFGLDYPFITPTDIKDYDVRYNYSTERFVSEKWMVRKKNLSLPKNSTCFVCIGSTIGKMCLVKETSFTNQQINAIINDPAKSDSLFIYYLLKNNKKDILKEFGGGGAAKPIINKSTFEGIEVEFPKEIFEQEKIAFILSAFDDKIELNNKIAKNLEEMAQAIFKEWFVHFHFPRYEKAEFINSELGKIPKGWIVADFSKIANISKKTINPTSYEKERFLHYSLPAFDSGQEPIVEEGLKIKSNKSLLPNSCILISKLNPQIPRLWLVDNNDELRSISSTEFLVIVPVREFSLYFIYSLCRSSYFQNIFKVRTTGTSTSHQRVRPHDLLNIPLALPPDDMIKTFHFILLSNFILSQKIKKENNKLAALRDLLLPKLMKGEIRV